MKKMSLVIALVVTVTLFLSACGGANPVANSQPEGCLGSSDSAVVDLDCRKIVIAVENAYLPFNYIEVKSGKAGGWDYEAWTEICTRLHCTPVYQEAAWEGMIQAVSNKQYDVAADGITITEERKQIVDFSQGYIQINQRLLVRKGDTRFDSIEAFATDEALVMGTQANTTNYETAKGFLPEGRLKAFEQFPFAIQALISGDVDAVIIDEVVGMGYMGENAEALELIGPSISSDALGFVYAKGSDLVEPVNKALDAMRADGTLDKLNKKFFGPDFKISSEDIQ